MYNILTLNKISAAGLGKFDKEKYFCTEDCASPDAVIVRSASMHDTEIPSSVLSIARAGAGYNNIPVDKCTENGICVFNTPGANANAVKELVLCALFLSSRKIVAGAKWCETLKGSGDEVSKKVEKGKSNFAGPEIKGKTLGVIGLGAIGVLVANGAKALGMDVIGYDPFLSDKAASMLDKTIRVTSVIDRIFEESDYITLHAPLNDSTKNTICAETLAKCKDGVRILNFARGELVNNSDILSALENGKCSAYATDFPTDDQLCTDGVIALPHLGASTPESEENCAVMAVEQTVEYIENGNVINSVNLPCVSKDRVPGKSRITVITDSDVSAKIFECLDSKGVDRTDASVSIRKNTGYVIIDTDSDVSGISDDLKSIDGVIRVRVL